MANYQLPVQPLSGILNHLPPLFFCEGSPGLKAKEEKRKSEAADREHLDGIKDDRMKSGADMLVQADRGYPRNTHGRWEQWYKPFHVVLFEDISRYRTRQDRPMTSRWFSN